MTIGEIIAHRRKEIGLTLEDVGKAVGVGKSTVKKWESGYISNMRRDKIALLANTLQMDPSVLINAEKSGEIKIDTSETAKNLFMGLGPAKIDIDDFIAKHPELFRPKMKKVPVLGGVACGEPIYSPNLDEEFALINEDIAADFALVCKGNSMIDVGINDGDVVFIRKQETVDNGQIAAVVIGEEVTLKRVYYYREKNKLVLQPANPDYEPLIYTNYELDEIRILGRAVAQLRKIR